MEIYMENHQNVKYRYERKYRLKPVELPSFYFHLNSIGYSELFEERRINNIYLDDIDFSSIMDNIDGLSTRKKYRIRWYGKPFSNSNKQFEIKHKSEFLNTKEIIDLGLYQIKGLESINQSYLDLKHKIFLKNNTLFNQITSHNVKLFNTYKRKYFLSKCENVRITIDNSLEFYSPLTHNVYKENDIIVEAKYLESFNFNEPFNFLKIAKYSKYIKGVMSTTFYNPSY